MANDHHVAQTYLRHFTNPPPDGTLHGYSKKSGKNFPCRPKDVCAEWEGDINEEWLTDRPELRGDFRRICEPRWNPTLDAIKQAEVSSDDRFIVSAMAATLMACTPTWSRVTTKMHDQFATGFAIAAHDLPKRAGKEPEFPEEYAEALRSGKVFAETAPKYVEALNTRHLLRHTWMIYNQDWTALVNPTSDPFITSDNPFAYRKAGPNAPVERYLPLTPQQGPVHTGRFQEVRQRASGTRSQLAPFGQNLFREN